MQTQLRIATIRIENTLGVEDIWITVAVEKLTLTDEGEVIQVFPNNQYISKKLSEFFSDLFVYSDPVTGDDDHNISGAGVQMAIRSAIHEWIIENYGGTAIDGEIWL